MLKEKSNVNEFEPQLTTNSNAPQFDLSAEEHKLNLVRMLELNLPDFERLQVYQQLGHFKSAIELLEKIKGLNAPQDSPFDYYQKLYLKEITKRIEIRNANPFLIERTYLVVP
jgi:hypothetical protein